MNSSIQGADQAVAGRRWAGFLAAGAIACVIAVAAHVYAMSALKISGHLLSIRLERATGCERYRHSEEAEGQGAHPAVDTYIDVCFETPESTDRRSYFLMLDLEQVPRRFP